MGFAGWGMGDGGWGLGGGIGCRLDWPIWGVGRAAFDQRRWERGLAGGREGGGGMTAGEQGGGAQGGGVGQSAALASRGRGRACGLRPSGIFRVAVETLGDFPSRCQNEIGPVGAGGGGALLAAPDMIALCVTVRVCAGEGGLRAHFAAPDKIALCVTVDAPASVDPITQ